MQYLKIIKSSTNKVQQTFYSSNKNIKSESDRKRERGQSAFTSPPSSFVAPNPDFPLPFHTSQQVPGTEAGKNSRSNSTGKSDTGAEITVNQEILSPTANFSRFLVKAGEEALPYLNPLGRESPEDEEKGLSREQVEAAGLSREHSSNTRDVESQIISNSREARLKGTQTQFRSTHKTNSSSPQVSVIQEKLGGSEEAKVIGDSERGYKSFSGKKKSGILLKGGLSLALKRTTNRLSFFPIKKGIEIFRKMDHEDLIAELPQIEKLSNQERLRLAHKRRMLQLKRFNQYDKEIGSRKHNKGGFHDVKKGSKGLNGLSNGTGKKGTRIRFRNSIMLLEAAGRNDVEEVRRILSTGVSPDVCNEDGLTALHQCCIDDNEEMMKLLLEYGANVNAEDSERWSPLHAAATCGHLHLVKYLIAKGANLLAVNAEGNMAYDICDEETTLDYIESEMAKRGVTQELIEDTRALPETIMLKDMQSILANGGDLEFRDAEGATPLHIAAANGYYRVVEFLLDNHVATDVQDKDNWQPIHASACWGHLDVLELLVQNGADLNARTRNNETPYAICEDPEIKERIIQLKNEQEVKKEANSRRLKRTQSSNSRTQSIRRTSQRDKGLTTKRDTANEAHVLMSRENSLKDNSPSPTAEPANGTNHNHLGETSSEEDGDVGSHHPAAFGRGSVSQIKIASNEAERLQMLAEKAFPAEPGTTTINNNLKSGPVKNVNVSSNMNNQNQNKPLNNQVKPLQVIDTNANLPKPEINPPLEKVQIGSNGISMSGSRDSLVGVGNGTIDIHVQVTINAGSPSSTLTTGGVLPPLPSAYPKPVGILPGSTLLTPPGTLSDLKKHRSLSRTTSNPLINGGYNDLPPKSAYGAPPSPTASLQRFVGEPTDIRDYGDEGKRCCVIV